MSTLVFPQLPGQSWSVFRRPMFSTQLRTTDSQREVTEIIMTTCYYEIEVSWEMLRNGPGFTELSDIQSLFLAMRGAYDYFLFTDPNSNTVINGGIGAGNGTNKFFTLGHNTGPSYFEAVGYVNQITNVKLNGVTVDPADYSISYPNVIVFDTAPADGVAVTATFTYYYLCRFGEDMQQYEQFMYKLYQLSSVTLKTVDY